MKWFSNIFHLIFLERCALCRVVSPGGICKNCMSSFSRAAIYRCSACNTLSALATCLCLQSDNYYFSRMAAFGYYEGAVKEVIAAFKYDKKKWLARPLGLILAFYMREELYWNDLDCIVPVPLYNDVLQTRGFNQTTLLAMVVGDELGIKISPSLLKKISPTLDQSKLGAADRKNNVKGAFSANPECKGKKILLLDDVFTTGATANEASKVLKETGAKDVSVLTFAMSQWKPAD